MALHPSAGCVISLVLCVLFVPPASAVEVQDLKAFTPLFGRYAPSGDCKRQPQVRVDAGGMSFDVAGKTERVTRLEFAASYGGNFYEGTSQWFFPFGTPGDWPVLMTFNAGEQAGTMTIEGHDQGWKGGPPLSPRHRSLVDGSPYRRCD